MMNGYLCINDREVVCDYLNETGLDKIYSFSQLYELVKRGLSQEGFCAYIKFGELHNDCL